MKYLLRKTVRILTIVFVLSGCATKSVTLTQDQARRLPSIGEITVTLPDEINNGIMLSGTPKLFIVYRPSNLKEIKNSIYLFINLDKSYLSEEKVVSIPNYQGSTIDSVHLMIAYRKGNDTTIYANADIHFDVIYHEEATKIEKLRKAKRYQNGDKISYIFDIKLEPNLHLNDIYFYSDKTITYGSGLSSV
jgi:hypothetical protein